MLNKIGGKAHNLISRYTFREKVLNYLQYLIFRLDTTKFIIDSPKLDYQPLPWKGICQAEIRGEATYSRWKQIAKHLLQQQGKSALDIGSCYGFFSIKMAEMGYDVIGVDLNSKHIRIARYAVPHHLRMHCNFLEMELTPNNINILPSVDYTLLLSVWHHWVYHLGLADATEMLATVWKHTRDVLFFESGESEVIDEFNLPFKSDNARQWLKDYLEKNCADSTAKIISEHPVGRYEHYTSTEVTRALFMVTRQQWRE